LERVKDRDTEFTMQDIERFLCDNKTSLNFVSSPYQTLEGNQFFDMNQFEIELECSVYEYANMTRDNLMIYYRFSNETVPKKSESDEIEGLDLYTQDFELSKLIVNRTDQNQQFFELELS